MDENAIIPHSRPLLGDREARSATDVILSGQLAQGKQVEAFERDVCREVGLRSACAVSSGVAALHLALMALGVGKSDQVIVPSFVCTALLHAVRYVGAVPVVADVDPTTGNMAPEDAAKKVTSGTKAIIVAHMFGMPADIAGLSELGPPVIEDCAQSIGACFDGRPLGTWGEAAVFSFYATKVIAAGEGGMLASNSTDLVGRALDLRDYDNRDDDAVRYNYKMTDLQAAIGRVQLSRLRSFLERRRMIAEKYDTAFRELNVGLPARCPGRIYFRYAIRLRGGAEPDLWIRKLRAKGVQSARPVYRPLHLYVGAGDCPRALDAWHRWLSIPIYPSLSDESVERVIRAVIETHDEENACR